MGDELEQVLRGKMLHDVLYAIPISHPIAVEIDRLTAELDRYKQGVELRCFLDFNELLQKSVIYIDDQTFSADLLGRRVRVLVMKEEEEG